MKLHRNTLLTAAAIVLILYVVSLIVGLPGWAAIVLTVVLLVLLAVVWKQPDEPCPVVTKPAPAPSVVLPDREPVFSGPPTRTVADVRLPSASPDFSSASRRSCSGRPCCPVRGTPTSVRSRSMPCSSALEP
ncbi:hypothetical protein OG558_40835 [Kribbella sp. NBC_01510]|uniref:hypothetical protein n=1 Tax=Kribbella sp. NBC_01510 TaxID=2903581 RepID=UPI00386C5CE7